MNTHCMLSPASILPPQNFDIEDNFEADQPADGIDVLQEQQPQGPVGDRPRITTRYMTKYERARVLGTRALQIRWVTGMQHLSSILT